MMSTKLADNEGKKALAIQPVKMTKLSTSPSISIVFDNINIYMARYNLLEVNIMINANVSGSPMVVTDYAVFTADTIHFSANFFNTKVSMIRSEESNGRLTFAPTVSGSGTYQVTLSFSKIE